MAGKNLARFRLCGMSLCVKGAVIPKNRTKPNGWTLGVDGKLYCPIHAGFALCRCSKVVGLHWRRTCEAVTRG